jgi:hypothetical protein
MSDTVSHHSLFLLANVRRSEALARQMMEKLRIAEEDDEFEKAFKNVMQVGYWMHVSARRFAFSVICVASLPFYIIYVGFTLMSDMRDTLDGPMHFT